MPKETFFRLRDEKQEGILRSAIHEFVEHGFERAKIGDIAKNSGVATGSIYQYFEDKHELYVYCTKWSLEVFMKKLDSRSNIKSMDIFEYFRDGISKIEVISEERELVIFMQSLSKRPDLMDASMKAMYEASNDYMKTLIQNSQDKGLVRTDIDNDLLMEYFVAVTESIRARLVNRNVNLLELNADSPEMQNELNQMISLLKKGMEG